MIMNTGVVRGVNDVSEKHITTAMIMEILRSPKNTVNFYQPTRRLIPEDGNTHRILRTIVRPKTEEVKGKRRKFLRPQFISYFKVHEVSENKVDWTFSRHGTFMKFIQSRVLQSEEERSLEIRNIK